MKFETNSKLYASPFYKCQMRLMRMHFIWYSCQTKVLFLTKIKPQYLCCTFWIVNSYSKLKMVCLEKMEVSKYQSSSWNTNDTCLLNSNQHIQERFTKSNEMHGNSHWLSQNKHQTDCTSKLRAWKNIISLKLFLIKVSDRKIHCIGHRQPGDRVGLRSTIPAEDEKAKSEADPSTTKAFNYLMILKSCSKCRHQLFVRLCLQLTWIGQW